MDLVDQVCQTEEKEYDFAIREQLRKLKESGGDAEPTRRRAVTRKRACENPSGNQDCEGMISSKRLEAMPNATLCLNCQEKKELGN